MYRNPDYSPWGEVDECYELIPGMYLVGTPSHGGILVEQQALSHLSHAAQKCGFRDGAYLCFEEDCCEPVVLRELMDQKLWKPPERIKDPVAYEETINRIIRDYHPEYWAAREKRLNGTKAPKRRKSVPTR